MSVGPNKDRHINSSNLKQKKIPRENSKNTQHQKLRLVRLWDLVLSLDLHGVVPATGLTENLERGCQGCLAYRRGAACVSVCVVCVSCVRVSCVRVCLCVCVCATPLTCRQGIFCLLYTSPSPRDRTRSRMPSSA